MIYENPEILVEKLKTDGWEYIPRKRSDIAIFQNEIGDKFFQVTIPLDRNLGDFEEALQEAWKEVELFEQNNTKKTHLVN